MHPRNALTNIIPLALLLLTSSSSSSSSPVDDLVIHVSTHLGSDESGDGSSSRPYHSVQRGIDAALSASPPHNVPLSLHTTTTSQTSTATVLLHPGLYRVAEPVEIRGGHHPNRRLHLTSSATTDGGVATITGTLPLPPPLPLSPSDPLLPYLSPAVASRVLVAPLPPSCNVSAGCELFWDDRPQVEARWPDNPVALSWATGNASLGARQGGGSSGCPDGIPVAAGGGRTPASSPSDDEPFLCAGWARSSPLENWTWDHLTASPSAPFAAWSSPSPSGAPAILGRSWRARGLFTYDWAGGESEVESFFPGNSSLRFTQATWNNEGYWGGARYYVVGAAEALTEGGEYLFALPAGGPARVYWLPPPSLPGPFSLSVSVAPTLLSLVDTSFVSVTGLALWGCTGDAVVLANVTDVTFAGNAVFGPGLHAVNAHFPANLRVNISSNAIAHTGDASVWIDGGDAATLVPLPNVTADSNVLVNFGRLGFAFNPAIGVDGVGTSASRNLVLSGPACGIMFGGPLQRIADNLVVDALRDTFDMGVVCDGPRDWTTAAVDLTGNALLRNGYTPLLSNHVSDPLRVGVYMDYGNFGHSLVGNVVWQPQHPATPVLPSSMPARALATNRWAIYNHGGRDMNVSLNLVVDINATQANGGGLEGGDKAQLTNGSHYYASLAACGGAGEGEEGWRQPPCSTLLPGLAQLDGFVSPDCASVPSCGPAPYNNSVVVNVAVPPPNGTAQPNPPPPYTLFQGPSEDVPATVRANLVADDPVWAAGNGSAARDGLIFALSPSSPAFALGFVQVDDSRWGPVWVGDWRALLRDLAPWAVCPPGLEAVPGCGMTSAPEEEKEAGQRWWGAGGGVEGWARRARGGAGLG
jgi:hypothetical protein